MPNNYYSRQAAFADRTKAKGGDVRSELDAVSAAFDLLPEPRNDGEGFAASIKVSDATEADHAVTLNQLEGTEAITEANKVAALSAQTAAEAAQAVSESSRDSAAASEAAASANQTSAAASEVSALASKDAAATSESNASLSAAAASASEIAADLSEISAAFSKDSAMASQISAASSEVLSSQRASEAATQAALAEAAKTSALESKTEAALSETNASNSEAQALASKNDAAASEASAASSRLAAAASEANAGTSEANAASSENAAAVSAAEALASLNAIGIDFTATSTTSLSVSIGSKTLAIEAGKAFVVGQIVKIASAANIANVMIGEITAASSGSISVLITSTGGSGTFSDWSISPNSLATDDSATSKVKTWSSDKTSEELAAKAAIGDIQDNLTDPSANKALSANQGRVLKELLDSLGISDISGLQNMLSSLATKTELGTKNDTLVSGANIKTVNGESLLGTGDLEVGDVDPTITGNGILYTTASYRVNNVELYPLTSNRFLAITNGTGTGLVYTIYQISDTGALTTAVSRTLVGTNHGTGTYDIWGMRKSKKYPNVFYLISGTTIRSYAFNESTWLFTLTGTVNVSYPGTASLQNEGQIVTYVFEYSNQHKAYFHRSSRQSNSTTGLAEVNLNSAGAVSALVAMRTLGLSNSLTYAGMNKYNDPCCVSIQNTATLSILHWTNTSSYAPRPITHLSLEDEPGGSYLNGIDIRCMYDPESDRTMMWCNRGSQIGDLRLVDGELCNVGVDGGGLKSIELKLTMLEGNVFSNAMPSLFGRYVVFAIERDNGDSVAYSKKTGIQQYIKSVNVYDTKTKKFIGEQALGATSKTYSQKGTVGTISANKVLLLPKGNDNKRRGVNFSAIGTSSSVALTFIIQE